MEEKKRKKTFIEKFLEYAKLNDDDDFDEYLLDGNLDKYYSKEKAEKKHDFYNAPHYDNQRLIDKLVIGELLNLKDLEDLMERTIKEFKRTFSAPNKDIEIVFREFKGEDFRDVIKEIYNDKGEDNKSKDIKSKDGDEDEEEKS